MTFTLAAASLVELHKLWGWGKAKSRSPVELQPALKLVVVLTALDRLNIFVKSIG